MNQQNNDEDEDPKLSPMTYRILAQAGLLTEIAWGLLILFGAVGSIAGYAAGAYVLMAVATIWVSLKIVKEAFVALVTLKTMRKAFKEIDAQDDGGPGPEQ